MRRLGGNLSLLWVFFLRCSAMGLPLNANETNVLEVEEVPQTNSFIRAEGTGPMLKTTGAEQEGYEEAEGMDTGICQLGWYLYQGSCYQCPSTCAVCNQNQCFACAEGFNLHPSFTTCISAPCPTSFFPQANTNICQPCSAHCLICSNSSQCQECEPNSQLDSITSSCTTPASRRHLEGCGTGCALCNDPLQCDACDENHSQDVPGPNCDLAVDECPVQKYREGSTGFCRPCGEGCQSCLQGHCEVCKADAFQYQETETCSLSQCPEGTLAEETTNICKNCVSGCKTCADLLECQTCKDNFHLDEDTKLCIFVECELGKYRNDLDNCVNCESGCKSCTPQLCLICDDNHVMNGDPAKQCIDTVCPSDKYRASANGYCVSCPPNCLSCTENSCTACDSDYYKQPGAVECDQTPCPGQFFAEPDTNVCQSCGQYCLKCTSAAVCLECLDTYQMADENTHICSTVSCALGKYRNTSGICVNCGLNCQSCDSLKCDICDSLHAQDTSGPDCPLLQCPSDKYRESETGFCKSCPSHCLVCSSANTCLKCADNYQMKDQSTPICSANPCVEPLRRNSQGVCVICGTNCKACQSADNCDVCDDQYALDNPPSSDCLLTECPEQKYRASTTGHCKDCSATCKSCSETVCFACANDLHQLLPGFTCDLDACPPAYYSAADTNFCLQCESGCLVCTDSSSCSQCKDNYTATSDNPLTCQNVPCSSGYYRQESGLCVKCGDNCKECKAANSCLSCDTGFFDQLTSNGVCDLTSCPPSTYQATGNHCLNCGSQCELCSNSSSCLRCKEGFQQASESIDCSDVPCSSPNFRDVNGHCAALGNHCESSSLAGTCDLCEANFYRVSGSDCDLTECPAAMFADSNGRCWSCGEGCEECATGSECKVCQSQTFHSSSSGTCLEETTCESGTWSDNGTCSSCGSHCEECENGSSCLICAPDYQLHNPESPDCTLEPCESPLARDKFGHCVNCGDENCEQCGLNNGMEVYCKTCLSEYQRDKIDSSCSSAKCQMGSYRDSDGVCRLCGSGCAACSDATSCDKCLAGYLQHNWPLRDCTHGDVCADTFYKDTNGHCQNCGINCRICIDTSSCGVCVDKHYQEDASESPDCSATPCSDGKFPEPATGHCALCGSGCLLCGPSSCSKCDTDMVQINLQSNSCEAGPCPEETYEEAGSGRCLPCGTGCLLCTASTCSKCDSGYVHIDFTTNVCVLGECPDGKYEEPESHHCQSCGSNCEICVDGDSCSACKPTFQQKVDEISPDCSETLCKLREYRDANGHCHYCGDNCRSCSDGESCSACDNAFYQEDPSSMRDCNPEFCSHGKYSNPDNGHCLPCGENCSICQNAISCSKCADTFQQQTTNTPKCSETPCEVTTFRDENGHCQPCGNNCFHCSITKLCESCSDTSHRLTNESIDCEVGACSEGYYRDTTGLCVLCGEHCLICTNDTSCELCNEGYQQQSLNTAFCSSEPCANGTYRLPNGHCSECGVNCAECNETKTCTRCSPQHYQDNNPDLSGCLDESCADGKYPADSGFCISCGTACATCESATKCLTCLKPETDAPLSGTNTCVTTNCLVNEYWIGTGCTLCDTSCASCSAESVQCIICSNGYFPTSDLPGLCTQQCDISCQSCASYSSQCTTCSSNYFPVEALPGLCTQVCDESCQTCSISAIICDECADEYLIETVLPGRCVKNPDQSCKSVTNTAVICSICSDEYQPYDKLPGKCVPKGSCHPSCKDSSSCNEAFTACSSCASDYQLSGAICTLAVCHSSCYTCNGPSYKNCVSCAAENTYLPALNMCQFKTCSGSCKTCYGSAADHCLSCQSHSSKSAASDYCVCDMFYTFKSELKACAYTGACYYKCLTCSGPGETNCLTCPMKAKLVESACMCEENYAWSESACLYKGLCATECATCSGSESTQCLSCPQNAKLIGTSCGCNTNYEWNLSHSKCSYAGACSIMCVSCNGPGENECTACFDSTNGQLNENSCICIENYTWNSETKKCQYSGICAEAFASCTGPNENQGTICDVNALKENSKCVCNTNFLWDSSVGKCLASSCSSICFTCTGPSSHQCDSCNIENHHILAEGTCICGDGYFGAISSTDDVCFLCHITCRQCTDSASDKCSVCYENASLTNASTCECQAGYFLNSEDAKCEACHSLCKNCSGALETECLSCRAEFTLTEDHSCVCSVSTFLNLETLSCDKCHSTCVSCLGPASNQCQTCVNGQTLANNVCVCTQEGKYNNAGVCSDCYNGCKTCAGPRSEQCLSCYSEAMLFSSPGPSTCICINPKRPAPTPKTCDLCPASCADCSQVDPNFCTACKSKAVPLIAAFPSACICEPGFYFDSSADCQPCHSTCQTCLSGSPFFCSVCMKYRNEGGLYCEDYCPSGSNPIQGACVNGASLIFSLSFSSMSTFKDTVNSYEVVSSSPLKVFYRQGVQLLGQQFIQLSPNSKSTSQLVLSSNHYIEVWLRSSTSSASQVILSKYIDGNTQLVKLATNDGTLTLTVLAYKTVVQNDAIIGKLYMSESQKSIIKVAGGSVTSGKTWSRVGYSVAFAGNGKSTTLTLYMSGSAVATETFEGVFFRDFNEGFFLLGGESKDLESSTFFKGGIAELRIFNGQSTVPTSASCPSGCPTSCSSSGMCLIPCANSEFLSSTSSACQTCSGACGEKGCVRGTDCSLNLDPLCKTYSDFTECTSCIDLAAANSQGICACVPDSTYNPLTSTCTCNSGFQAANQQCASCLIYFKSTEITAIFASDYMKVYVNFAKSVKTGVEGCVNIVSTSTMEKLGTPPTCIFDANRRKLTILLGIGTTLVQEEIEINNKIVVSSEGACNFSAETLRPIAKYPGDPLVPTASVAVSGQYSTVCGGGNGLEISGAGSSGGQGRPILYKWTFESDLAIAGISDYSSYSADNARILIPNSSLQTSTLKVTLTVKNFFGLENSSTKSVEIVATAALAVQVEGGSTVTMKSADKRVLKATVKGVCGGSTPNLEYKWTVVNGTVPSSVDLARNPLAIPANSLTAGKTYQLQVTATDTTSPLTGTALVTVIVTSGPLKVQCSRSDGEQSLSQDLIIDCSQSKDTDNPTASDLKASWTCAQGTGQCASASGGTLDMTTATGSALILKIPSAKLVNGATYILSLNISKDTRSDSTSISIAVVGATELQVSIAFENRNYSTKEDIQILSSVQGADSAEIASRWTQKSGQSLVLRSRQDATFLSISAGSARAGEAYTFTLTVSAKSVSISASVTIQMSLPPAGGTAGVTPSSGKALVQDFTMRQSGWVTQDLPISASVSYIEDGNKKGLLVPSQANERVTKLFAGTIALLIDICDALNSCTTVPATATVSPPSRLLADTDLQDTFQLLTVDIDQIPSVCVIFGKSIALQQTLWDFILSKLNKYSTNLSDTSAELVMAELNCVAVLADIKSRQNQVNLEALVSAKDIILSKYQGSIQIEMFRTLFGLFSAYSVESARLNEHYSSLERRYLDSFLPDDEPAVASSPSISLYLARKTLSTLSFSVNRTDLNFTIDTPATFASDISASNNAVVDFTVQQYQRPSFPIGIIDINVQKVGTYGLIFTKDASISTISVGSLSEPINITLPVLDYRPEEQYQCVYNDQTEGWVSKGCSVLNVTNATASIQVWHLSTFTVVTKEIKTFTPDEMPPFSSNPNYDCDMWLAPVYIMITLVVIPLVVLLLLCVTGTTFIKKPPEDAIEFSSREVFKSEDPRFSQPSDRRHPSEPTPPGFVQEQIPDPAAQPVGSFRPAGDLASPNEVDLQMGAPVFTPINAPLSPPERRHSALKKPIVNPLMSFLEGHYAIGLVIVRQWPRWEKLLCLVTVLMCDLFFLGVFYYFLQRSTVEGEEVSDSYMWSEYLSEDARFYLYSFLLSIPISAIAAFLFNSAEMQARPETRRTLLGLGVAFCAVTTVLFIVLISMMNEVMCYEYVGRWCIGFLWCVLTELGALEFLLAAARLVLLKAYRTAK